MGDAIGNYAGGTVAGAPPAMVPVDFPANHEQRFRHFLRQTPSQPHQPTSSARPPPSVPNNKARDIAWRQAMQLRAIANIQHYYRGIGESQIKGSQIGDCDPQNCIGRGVINWQNLNDMMTMAPTGVPIIEAQRSFLDWALRRPGVSSFQRMNYSQPNLQSQLVENNLNGVPYYLAHNATSTNGVDWLPRLQTSALTNRVKLDEINGFIETWRGNHPNPTPFLSEDPRPMERIPG